MFRIVVEDVETTHHLQPRVLNPAENQNPQALQKLGSPPRPYVDHVD